MDEATLNKISRNFISVDAIGTRIIEDSFSYISTKGVRTLAVVATIPPLHPGLLEFNISSHLEALSKRLKEKDLKVPYFLDRGSRLHASLRDDVDKPVLFASFSLKDSPTVGNFILEETFGKYEVKVSSHSFEEFLEHSKVENLTKFLDQLIEAYPNIHARAFGAYQKTRINHGVGAWIVRIVCDLFNESCIKECRTHNIPYFGLSRHGKVEVYSEISFFNKPLRNILSFINSINLHGFMTHGKVTYTKEEVLSCIPPLLKQ